MWRAGAKARTVLAEATVITTDLRSGREPPPGPTANACAGEENRDSINRCEAIRTHEVTAVNGDATNPTADELTFQFITRRGELIVSEN